MPLTGYWPLKETSGSTARDYSGSGNDGTINGAGPQGSGTVTGILGQSAMSFDGNSDYIALGSTGFGSSNNHKSITAWVKEPSPSDGFDQIYSMSNNSDGSPNLMFYINSSGKVSFQTYSDADGTKGVQGNTTISTDTWTHIAGVYNPEEGYKVYLNGRKDGSTSSTSFITNNQVANIGRRPDGTGQLEGDLAEIRTYNHALTPRDIQYLYQVSQRGRMLSNKKRS